MIFDRNTILENPQEPSAAAPAATSTPAEQAAPAVTSAPAAPVQSTSTSASVAAPAVSQTPASPVGGATSTGTPAPAAPSWLDSFRSAGFQSTESDETRVREQLIQSHRDAERLRPLAPVLSAYQRDQAQFQQWQQEQQKKAAATAQEDWTAKLGYNHPEWNPSWRHQVTQDASGNLVPAPGAPADIVLKYQQAQAFRQEQVEKFLNNPFKYMEPAIRHIAGEISGQAAQQNVGQYREQQEAQGFIREHSSWLFDKNQDGSIKQSATFNPQTGRHDTQQVLSHWGQVFVSGLQEAVQMGLQPAAQQKYAMSQLQNQYMSSPQYAQELAAKQAAASGQAVTPPANPREAANAAFIAKANPAQTPQPGAGNTTPAKETVNRNNLEKVMLERFRNNGVKV